MAKTDKTPKGQTGAQGIKIFTHGKYYFKTDNAKGAKSFVQVVRAKSLEMFRESYRKYIGQIEDPVTHLQRDNYKETTYLNVRGQLKKRLLPIMLAKLYPDFARVRYVVIDEVVSETGENLDLPLNLRSKSQLAEMVREEKIPVDVDEYLEVDELREDIRSYIQEPEAFLHQKPLKDKRRQEERSFLEMNDLGEETLPPMKPKKEMPAKPESIGKGVLDD